MTPEQIEMTPEQNKSLIYMISTMRDIIQKRILFNTTARAEMVKCFRIAGALLEEDLMTTDNCKTFNHSIDSLNYLLNKSYFLKYKIPLTNVLHGMTNKARINLYRKLLDPKANQATYIEEFIKIYGGEEQMRRFICLV